MTKTLESIHHMGRPDWVKTPDGDARGYIQPESLKELWFHTGTACNLSCSFCLEGSKPGDQRLQFLTFDEVKPFVDEAMEMGVEQFSFTGGEPFINKDFINILNYSLERRPCTVLTNGTHPIRRKMNEVRSLKRKEHPLSFRISLDYPDPALHDKERGQGNFHLAVQTLGELHKEGFHVSVARQQGVEEEDPHPVNDRYKPFFSSVGIQSDIPFVVFPDFLPPGSIAHVPYVTEKCMKVYKDEKSRSEFMCNFSKMVDKKDGKLGVYACTLVDDDPDYDLGHTLKEAMPIRVMLKHHRCYSCFAYGASCSEANK